MGESKLISPFSLAVSYTHLDVYKRQTHQLRKPLLVMQVCLHAAVQMAGDLTVEYRGTGTERRDEWQHHAHCRVQLAELLVRCEG